MKKLILGIIATMMFSFVGFAQKSVSADTFFEIVLQEASNIKGENVLYITADFNTKENKYSNYKFEIKEPNFFVFDEVINSVEGKKYTVTCTKGGKTLWTDECDGKFSCGSMIYKCLEGGGCGTICQGKMVYIPQTKNLVLVN